MAAVVQQQPFSSTPSQNVFSQSKCSIISTINSSPFHSNTGDRKIYSSGAYYIGKLNGCRRNGWGQLNWLNGCCHKGNYLNNKKDGEGIYKWNDGSIFKGEFKNDLRHGYGKLCWPNGEKYEGNFFEDMKHGFGTYSWPENEKYEGIFHQNKKHGYGVFTFRNGDVFEGCYKDDHRFGPGIFTYKSTGEQDVGIWKGKTLLRICSVIDDAILFEHLKFHCINAGEHLHQHIRLCNSGLLSKRTPIKQISSFNVKNLVAGHEISTDFPYQDIVEGVRSVESPKGILETSSRKLIQVSSEGDFETVKEILENGCVNPNVMDKTGYFALIAAAVNCHTDILNILLNHGANINQLTDEGLSALLACHILLYSEQNFIENTAEKMPSENLFNTTDVDKKTGAVINRNDRKMIMAIYEELHRPFMNVKKTRPSVTSKKRGTIRCRRVLSSATGNSDECSFGMHSSSDEWELDLDNAIAWKVEFYKKSIDHVNEVEQINKTFKEMMIDPHACFVDRNRHHTIVNENCSTSSRRSSNISSHSQSETQKNEVDQIPGPIIDVGNNISSNNIITKSRKKLLSTTVASNFGYASTLNAMKLDVENPYALNHMINERKPHLQNTIEVLLKRGANPNASTLPMSALFFAVKSADPVAVEELLKQGADTSARLKNLKLCPLHIAVALPGSKGIEITRLLLQYGADPNLSDNFPVTNSNNNNNNNGSNNNSDINNFAGRMPLHIVCSREDDYKECQKIARLLLEYGANPNVLCAGNAPLSLAIASGNDLVVDMLLMYNANPSLKLTNGLGSILCVAASFQAERRRTPSERIKLIEKLFKAGVDMLVPVRISEKYPPGTVVDYAYHVFSQDRRIACTPYHALSSIERECYNSRRAMLECIGSHLREAALLKEKEMNDKGWKEEIYQEKSISIGSRMRSQARPMFSPNRDEFCGLRSVNIKVARHPSSQVHYDDGSRKQDEQESRPATHASSSGVMYKRRLRYCYECGRSIGIRLSPCTRCKEVFYCSKGCKVKAWNLRHKEECGKLSGIKSIALQSRADSPTPTSDARLDIYVSKSVSGKKTDTLNIERKKATTESCTTKFLPQI